jgi:hypothetical protein
MVVISPQIQAAEMRRREAVVQSLYEQWVDEMLAPTALLHPMGPAQARASLSRALCRSIRDARHRLTRLAVLPSRASSNEARMLEGGVR